jgi:hypothetical protein
MNRRTSVFRCTLWSLLSLWAFFGCLELIEESHIFPAAVEDAQEGEDFDEEALAQLASGLKSDLSGLEPLNSTSAPSVVVQPAGTPSERPIHLCARFGRHGPFSLPLYQQLSVYRI